MRPIPIASAIIASQRLSRRTMARINAEGWRALKMLALENDTTLNALAIEAFNDLLKKHGKRQNIKNPLLD